jgi:hypothetical protein
MDPDAPDARRTRGGFPTEEAAADALGRSKAHTSRRKSGRRPIPRIAANACAGIEARLLARPDIAHSASKVGIMTQTQDKGSGSPRSAFGAPVCRPFPARPRRPGRRPHGGSESRIPRTEPALGSSFHFLCRRGLRRFPLETMWEVLRPTPDFSQEPAVSTGANGTFRSHLEAQADAPPREVEKTAVNTRTDRVSGLTHHRETRESIKTVAEATNNLRSAYERLNNVNPDIAREVRDLVKDISNKDGAQSVPPDAIVDRIRQKAYSMGFFAHQRADLLFRATKNPEALDAIKDVSSSMRDLLLSYERLTKINRDLTKEVRVAVNEALNKKGADPISADAMLGSIRDKARDMRSSDARGAQRPPASGARGRAGAERD